VEPFSELLAQLFITAYWGYRGIATVLPGDLAEAIGSDEWSAVAAFFVLVLHMIVFAGLTLGVVFYDDASARSASRRALDHGLTQARAKLGQTVRAMEG